MNRSKQAGMARKTIIVVWLVGLTLACVVFIADTSLIGS
jgi:hypothetical protein